MSQEKLTVTCPHCDAPTEVVFDGTYKPAFKICNKCWKRFIYEQTREGMQTYKPSEADRSSDPEYRDTECGAGDD